MNKTPIGWTDYSSNPIRAIDPATGARGWSCTKVSRGCDHCYAAALNNRLGTRLPYDKAGADASEWILVEDELAAILRSRATGRRVFVADMTDLFHERVRRAWYDRLFATFARRPDLTFQLLTKRPPLAAHYLNDPDTPRRVATAMATLPSTAVPSTGVGEQEEQPGPAGPAVPFDWPLPNVWLGTSVEDGGVTYRIAQLRRCPAALRFLSCEPLLGPLPGLDLAGIGWLIAGGESGPGHRPVHIDWLRDLRDQCRRASIPFFFKQWGGSRPTSGGKVLDGREWCAFPRGPDAFV